MKLHLKESDENLTINDFMMELDNIPAKDIDHWETDLYLRKTPKTTELIKTKLPKDFKVNTFIDDIDKVPWYEIPFAFPKQRNRRGTVKESSSTPKTLSITLSSIGAVDVPTTTKWPTGKKVWNIGHHNPYIKDGYVIVCNTRDFTIVPESLEFVYVGPENAQVLHKQAGKGTVNDKNYTKFLVADIDLDETCLMENSDDVETWDVYYWDKEDEESYNLRQVHMTNSEAKEYVDNLNATMSDYDKERGWWDYEMA
jgi:hypothetical protein